MKQIAMLFYEVNPSPENTGLKYVLWEVSDGKNITYDWGFADWDGKQWGAIETPEGYTAKVIWWANTANPDLLVKPVKGKIITI